VPTSLSQRLDAFCEVVVSADTRIRCYTVMDFWWWQWHPLKLLDPSVCLVVIRDASDVSSALDLIQSVRLFA
jgi:hypothetical protein